ncbi:uncharacterized protein LOC124933072 [Impatiens glandulifera]|uniref:uncharacterized protein LOC124933072 n=1 Tax=Impatiens glandulifera TaxID=253017 RepID=UPI001FB06770|nr:uncharacterized protein LOC124933072 [Impatiens glandulifera]
MENQDDRKSNGGDDHWEEGETEKMEKFFAVIRNFRDARDRRLKELMKEKQEEEEDEDAANKRIKLSPTPTADHRKTAAGTNWVPTFEWEDFRPDITLKKKKRDTNYRSGQRKGKDDDEEEEDGLKLKLSLS